MAPIPIPTRNQVAGNRPLNETDRSPESSPDRSSYQVVIEVRSTRDPSQSERITIDDPTPELIQYLGRMNQQ
jgi:hypothetical protein